MPLWKHTRLLCMYVFIKYGTFLVDCPFLSMSAKLPLSYMQTLHPSKCNISALLSAAAQKHTAQSINTWMINVDKYVIQNAWRQNVLCLRVFMCFHQSAVVSFQHKWQDSNDIFMVAAQRSESLACDWEHQRLISRDELRSSEQENQVQRMLWPAWSNAAWSHWFRNLCHTLHWSPMAAFKSFQDLYLPSC